MPEHLFPSWISTLFAGLGGAVIGSFFNVVIYRIPRGESVIWPASHCPHCSSKIAPWQNIPVLSWLFLKGKCANCRASINIIYPIVEFFTALVSLILFYWLFILQNELSLSTKIALYYYILITIPIFYLDFKHYLIPDVLNYSGIILAIPLAFLPGGLTIQSFLIGLFGCGFIFWATGFLVSRLLKKEALGLGDVKLLAMSGALFGLSTSLLGLFIGAFVALIAIMPILIFRKGENRKYIPFGPFICTGVIIATMWGDILVSKYLELIRF
ncbi:MAG: prepilin peptidase [Fibrobacteria bacterium]|nr:prepilin peptidase [Fibrobacteria bacterium]